MVCIYCGQPTRVSNSRHQKKVNQVWRRRECSACHSIFSTLEGVDLERSIVVQNGKALEPFSRDKLFITIYEACRHRNDATSAATALTATAISKLLPLIQAAALERTIITDITAEILNRFDKAAGVHYLAYHPLPRV